MIPTIIVSDKGSFLVCPKCAHNNKITLLEHLPQEGEILIVCEYCDEPTRFTPNVAHVEAEI